RGHSRLRLDAVLMQHLAPNREPFQKRRFTGRPCCQGLCRGLHRFAKRHRFAPAMHAAEEFERRGAQFGRLRGEIQPRAENRSLIRPQAAKPDRQQPRPRRKPMLSRPGSGEKGLAT
ncbi:MAG: hypothetical protein ACK56I_22435, partial [bacterium]